MRTLAKLLLAVIAFEVVDHLYPRLGAPDWMNWPAMVATVLLIVCAWRAGRA